MIRSQARLLRILDTWLLAIPQGAEVKQSPQYMKVIRILKKSKDALGLCIGLLETFERHGDEVLLVVLPELTGEDPVPPDHKTELTLILYDWLAWAKQKGIEPILE